MVFTVTFVRHAETDFNRNSLTQSNSNVCINATGVAQAEALGLYLANQKFTKVYSSDLIRTQDTTKIILEKSNNPAPEIVLDQNLRERDMGEWEGQGMTSGVMDLVKSLKGSKMGEEIKNGNYIQLLAAMNPPGGETQEQIMTRITQFVEQLCEACDRAKESENVLVVTHGIWLISFLSYLQSQHGEKFAVHGLDLSCMSLNALQTGGGPQNTCVTKMTVHKIKEADNGQRQIEIHDLLKCSHLSTMCDL